MDDFVTVFTVSYAHQLLMIKPLLEAENINYFIKDELTIQSDPLWSNALGGIKIQVQKQDVDRAVKLLKDCGYLKDEPYHEDLLTKVDRKTAGIPLLKYTTVVNRIIIITIIVSALSTALIYYIIKPSKADLLTKMWCVDAIYYKNQLIGPKTLNTIQLVFSDSNGQQSCDENIDFKGNGEVNLPGVNTRMISGNWKLDSNEELELSTDTLKNIFQGEYTIDVNWNSLVLRSKTTVINAHTDGTP